MYLGVPNGALHPARNEIQHKWLLKLLADEEAEDAKPLESRH
jgi:hypothetical protein